MYLFVTCIGKLSDDLYWIIFYITKTCNDPPLVTKWMESNNAPDRNDFLSVKTSRMSQMSSISINLSYHQDMKKKLTNSSQMFFFCTSELFITKTGHDTDNLLCFHICDASTGCGTEKSLVYIVYV